MSIVNYENSLGIARDDMPQIDAKLVPHFVAHLHSTFGINSVLRHCTTGVLRPTQKHFNQERVNAKLLEAESDGIQVLFKPVMVSAYGNRILDGHNTVEAIRQYNKKHNDIHKVVVISISYAILDLLRFADIYQYSHKKSINQIT